MDACFCMLKLISSPLRRLGGEGALSLWSSFREKDAEEACHWRFLVCLAAWGEGRSCGIVILVGDAGKLGLELAKIGKLCKSLLIIFQHVIRQALGSEP